MTAVVMRGDRFVRRSSSSSWSRPGAPTSSCASRPAGSATATSSVLTGDLAVPLPVVLGHEGAGVVVEVGADVTTVRPGDRVVLSAIPTCGRCYFCARGEPYLCAARPRSGSTGSAPTAHGDPRGGRARHVLRRRRRLRAGGGARAHRSAGRAAGADRVRRRHRHRLGDQPGDDRARRQRARDRRRRHRAVPRCRGPG